MDLPDDRLIALLDVPLPRYTSYPTVPAWSRAFSAKDHQSALAHLDPQGAVSLYLHIPFCKTMCSYCGCNVVVTHDQSRVERYLEMLEREIALSASLLPSRLGVDRIHLGGGTPTFLRASQLESLLATIEKHFSVSPSAERSIEAKPDGLSPRDIAALGGLGFNRLSLGVQDLDSDVREAVRREGSVEELASLVDAARATGFSSVNFDLIYGLPLQTAASFAETIETVCALEPDRVAIFSFAYLPELRPNQRRLGLYDMPTGRKKLALFVDASNRLIARGYRAVGMDHFARETDELAIAAEAGDLWRDFQGYTTRRGTKTLAFGVSAISDLHRAYVQNVKGIGEYERAVASGRLPIERGIVLSDDDRLRREIITDLMCNFEVDVEPLSPWSAREAARLGELVDLGLVEREGSRLIVTERGRLFVRNIAAVFDAHFSDGARHARAI